MSAEGGRDEAAVDSDVRAAEALELAAAAMRRANDLRERLGQADQQAQEARQRAQVLLDKAALFRAEQEARRTRGLFRRLRDALRGV
jgi:hypothetical protein